MIGISPGISFARPRIVGAAPPAAAFVSAVEATNVAHPFADIQAGDELLYFAQHNTNLDPPALTSGWDEIVAAHNGTTAWAVGWRKTAVGGETDPLPLEVTNVTRKILVIYRGLQFKAASGTRGAGNNTTMIVPAKAATVPEWGVAFCFSAASQTDMEPSLPEEATNLNAGTGVLRGERQGSSVSWVLGDTAGGNAGWAEKQSTISTASWLTAAFLLEPV